MSQNNPTGCSTKRSLLHTDIAAQQSHREACFALTAWYLVGSPGVLPQSDTEAYLWARKAADLELAKAEYAVGYFTESGIGTYQDQREALDWFRLAASHGDKRALDRLRIAGIGVSGAVPAQSRRQPAAGTPYKPPPVTKIVKKDGQSGTGPPAQSERQRGKSVDRGKGKDVLPPLPGHDSHHPTSNVRGSGAPLGMSGTYRDARRPDLPRQRSSSTPVNKMDSVGPQDHPTGSLSRLPPLPLQDFGPVSLTMPPGAAPPMHGYQQSYNSSSLPPRTHSSHDTQFQHNQQQQHLQRSKDMPQLPPGAGRGLAEGVQVRMPDRQGGGSDHRQAPTSNASSAVQQRDKALLQRRSGPGEDKDCLVM